MTQALRFDGLWWRKFAYLGSVYGPEWWKQYSPPVIAAIIFALVKSNRRDAITNMERILGVTGAPAAAAALRMFVEFAHCMTETMEHYGPRPKPLKLEVPADNALADALGEGRGAVVVTGHFGNWDVGAKALSDYGRPVSLVMAREVNATTHEHVRQARERAGVRVIYSDSSVFSSLNAIRALRRNEITAMQLDRATGPSSARLIRFFGAPARFSSGPFALARLSGAPLIPVFIPRLGTRHYAVRVGSSFAVPREARDTHALERVMAEVVGELETVVRCFPTQWFQFSHFWPGNAVAADTQGSARRQRSERPRAWAD